MVTFSEEDAKIALEAGIKTTVDVLRQSGTCTTTVKQAWRSLITTYCRCPAGQEFNFPRWILEKLDQADVLTCLRAEFPSASLELYWRKTCPILCQEAAISLRLINPEMLALFFGAEKGRTPMEKPLRALLGHIGRLRPLEKNIDGASEADSQSEPPNTSVHARDFIKDTYPALISHWAERVGYDLTTICGRRRSILSRHEESSAPRRHTRGGSMKPHIKLRHILAQDFAFLTDIKKSGDSSTPAATAEGQQNPSQPHAQHSGGDARHADQQNHNQPAPLHPNGAERPDGQSEDGAQPPGGQENDETPEPPLAEGARAAAPAQNQHATPLEQPAQEDEGPQLGDQQQQPPAEQQPDPDTVPNDVGAQVRSQDDVNLTEVNQGAHGQMTISGASSMSQQARAQSLQPEASRHMPGTPQRELRRRLSWLHTISPTLSTGFTSHNSSSVFDAQQLGASMSPSPMTSNPPSSVVCSQTSTAGHRKRKPSLDLLAESPSHKRRNMQDGDTSEKEDEVPPDAAPSPRATIAPWLACGGASWPSPLEVQDTEYTAFVYTLLAATNASYALIQLPSAMDVPLEHPTSETPASDVVTNNQIDNIVVCERIEGFLVCIGASVKRMLLHGVVSFVSWPVTDPAKDDVHVDASTAPASLRSGIQDVLKRLWSFLVTHYGEDPTAESEFVDMAGRCLHTTNRELLARTWYKMSDRDRPDYCQAKLWTPLLHALAQKTSLVQCLPSHIKTADIHVPLPQPPSLEIGDVDPSPSMVMNHCTAVAKAMYEHGVLVAEVSHSAYVQRRQETAEYLDWIVQEIQPSLDSMLDSVVDEKGRLERAIDQLNQGIAQMEGLETLLGQSDVQDSREEAQGIGKSRERLQTRQGMVSERHRSVSQSLDALKKLAVAGAVDEVENTLKTYQLWVEEAEKALRQSKRVVQFLDLEG